jgi:predicted NUDIX family phosphoesterase
MTASAGPVAGATVHPDGGTVWHDAVKVPGPPPPADEGRAGVRLEEQVLCIPRRVVLPDGAWHGLVTTGLWRVLRVIRAAAQYRRRGLVEGDPTQLQLVTYGVVRHGDGSHLLVRRRRRSGEGRLQELHALGAGSHITPGDGAGGDPVVGGLRRGWREQLRCGSPATARLVAVLSDGTPASRLHLGLVFLVEPRWGWVTVRDTERLEGEVLGLELLDARRPAMEPWSQLVHQGLLAGLPDGAGESPLVVELEPAP